MLNFNCIRRHLKQTIKAASKYNFHSYSRLVLLALTVPLLLSIYGCTTESAPKDFSRVANIKPSENLGINSIRLTSLKETARSIGAQAGLSWRSQQINRTLLVQKKYLDKIFNFNYLILHKNVLPPVLAEGLNTLNLADNRTIRISEHDYQIVYPPRFITAPPSWRDYLWMAYQRPEIPNNTLLPKKHNEALVWNQYVKVGWKEGVAQANEIFNTNVNRLTRDFNGMILYRKLLAQNMVSPPYVAEADLGVTGGGDNLRINDRVLRITAISELQANSKVWRPVVAKGAVNGNDGSTFTSPELADYRKIKEKI